MTRLQIIDTQCANIVLLVDNFGQFVKTRKRAKSMSILEKDGLEARLFSRRDRKLVNIKFMRGSAKVIEANDLCAAVSTLIENRDNGTPSAPAKSGKTSIDVRYLASRL